MISSSGRRLTFWPGNARRMLLPEEPEDKRYDQRNQDAGGEREEKRIILFRYTDVARKPAQPGELVGEH